MSGVSGKSRCLYNSLERRKRNQELNKGNSVSKTFLVSMMFLIVFSVTAGVWIGMQSNRVSLDEMNQSYSIDGYNIYFTSPENDPQMEGANGYTYIGSNNIFLNENLVLEKDFEQLMRTCNHEILHTLGISGNHHDRIDSYERKIDDPVCNKLMNKIAY